MIRTTLLTAAATLALMAPAYAEDAANGGTAPVQTSFARTISAIKDWFGPAKPEQAAPAAETDTASTDGDIQVPPPPGVQAIEPAAGFDDELLQVPPPYVGPQSNASGAGRATAFDNNASVAAFNDPVQPSASDMANMAPASGDGTEVDMSKVDCKAVLKAAENTEEGADLPDTAIIEACETPTDATGEPVKDAAQPALEGATPPAMPQALPETQPSAGEPPIGGAVMPGAPATPAEAPKN